MQCQGQKLPHKYDEAAFSNQCPGPQFPSFLALSGSSFEPLNSTPWKSNRLSGSVAPLKLKGEQAVVAGSLLPGPRAWGRAALLCAQLCPRCRWECRVPAASHRAEGEGGSGWIPQEISVGCKDRERTRRRRRSTQSTLAACPGLFWRRGAGFVCCQGTLPAAERGPLCHLPLPTGGSCLGALDHKGLKELG